ncbi:MAG: hypothetical protein CMH55_06685 [Myxococcales bacterium]|nr:hypothetical protein [Myxococcales bacterium]
MWQAEAPHDVHRPESDESLARPEPSLKQRLVVGLTLMIVLIAIYLLINHGITADSSRAFDVSTAWDYAIPLTPAWVWIYALNVPMPMALILGTREGREYAELAAGFTLICLIAFAIFLVFPVTTAGLRPESLGTGWSNWGLSVYYTVDGRGNCLPSLHVSLCCYSGLWGLCRFRRLPGVAYFILGIAISISTMFVKQHWIADVVVGGVLGFGVAAVQLRGLRLGPYLPGPMRRAIIPDPERPAS